MKKIISYALVILLLASCSSVPLTGRKQLLLVSDSEVLQASALSYTEYMSTAVISKNITDTKKVETVGKKIAAAVEKYLKDNGMESEIANFSWSYSLVKDTTANAFCMPGGKVVFYEGIIPYCQTEAGIAVVMGHEIAHVVAKHGNERMIQQMLVETGSQIAGAAVSSKTAVTQQLVQTVYGLGTQVGVLLPYSRKHEYEADHLGLIFMAMAGYNPAEAVTFWERMSVGKGASTDFLSTHPSDAKRIAALKTLLPEAQKYYTK